jgi:uncharacterized protein YfkK (UPF0435 family)
MRLSDLDLQMASQGKQQDWVDRLDDMQHKDLQDLHQFIKDNGIQLSDLDKRMIAGANDLNREVIARQLTTKLKSVYAGFGEDYDAARQLRLDMIKQKEVAQTNSKLQKAADSLESAYDDFRVKYAERKLT